MVKLSATSHVLPSKALVILIGIIVVSPGLPLILGTSTLALLPNKATLASL